MGKTYRSKGYFLMGSTTAMKKEVRKRMRNISKREFAESVKDYEMNGDCSYGNSVRSSFKVRNHTGVLLPYDFSRLGSYKMEVTYNTNIYSNFNRVLKEYIYFVQHFRYLHEKELHIVESCSDEVQRQFWKTDDRRLRDLFKWEVLNVKRRDSDGKYIVGETHKWFKKYMDHPILRQLERRGRVGIFKKHLREKDNSIF